MDQSLQVHGYRRAQPKHLAIRNGKLLREFNKLYDTLQIAGYYRGLLYDDEHVTDALKATRTFIKKVSSPDFSIYFGRAISFPSEPGILRVEIPYPRLSISCCVDLWR